MRGRFFGPSRPRRRTAVAPEENWLSPDRFVVSMCMREIMRQASVCRASALARTLAAARSRQIENAGVPKPERRGSPSPAERDSACFEVLLKVGVPCLPAIAAKTKSRGVAALQRVVQHGQHRDLGHRRRRR